MTRNKILNIRWFEIIGLMSLKIEAGKASHIASVLKYYSQWLPFWIKLIYFKYNQNRSEDFYPDTEKCTSPLLSRGSARHVFLVLLFI